MADQSQFGVTADGFVLKGIDRIVADQQTRAKAMFGDDVDLTSGSALRKVLDAVAWDAQELWRGLEAQYYANFVTTATGPSLDLLGTDLGMRPAEPAGHGAGAAHPDRWRARPPLRAARGHGHRDRRPAPAVSFRTTGR